MDLLTLVQRSALMAPPQSRRYSGGMSLSDEAKHALVKFKQALGREAPGPVAVGIELFDAGVAEGMITPHKIGAHRFGFASGCPVFCPQGMPPWEIEFGSAL